MSQNIFDTIIPSSTSGNQLATILNDLKDALMTGQSGTARPSQTQEGGYWVDVSVNNKLSYVMYDGSQDITVFTVDKTTGKVDIGGSDAVFEISKISDDTIGPILKLLKKRATGNGQTLTNDVLGEIDFFGTRDDGVEEIQAQIEVVSTDDVTSLAQGSELAVKVTGQGSPNLVEAYRVKGDGSIAHGFTGTTSKGIHTKGTGVKAGFQADKIGDDAISSKLVLGKERVADSGQVKLNDLIGTHEFETTTVEGNKQTVAQIEVNAVEDHTDAAHGVNMVIRTKKIGTNTFQEAIKIEDGQVSLLGVAQGTDIKSNNNLLDASTIRELFSIDGLVYSSFEIFAKFRGRDNAETRMQSITLSGVYDPINTEWGVTYTSSILKGAASLVDVDIPAENVQTLVVNYINQFADVDFIDGTIHLDIRRTVA